jgi:membrane carboxypeptidase/penicillin-binding protein
MKYRKQIGVAGVACLIILIGYESFSVIKARKETPGIFKRILSRRDLVRPGDISSDRIHRLFQIEDPDFYRHRGFDYSTPGAGLTTITQGMVKYLYFDRFKPGFMKIEQTLIAWLAVNALVSKEDQLTAFVNTAYLGTCEGTKVSGFAEAAHLFQKAV